MLDLWSSNNIILGFNIPKPLSTLKVLHTNILQIKMQKCNYFELNSSFISSALF